ncbi:GNAT family N-acetyltransferase [Deinococcus ruber]|uniref:N-acetyltransferase domain-containing protein n=1 Tax=Deinococcus ruber TaxID=1848197 RepID=A0A918EZ08_9DEIO|nr:GNAT family N-acetyltransferase [Deinococcus ruber]GGQ92449.1 hypothetical protein GCM10008957_00470 [Deinococcus ruber]
MHLLDNPFWHALGGPQQSWNEGTGLARRYQRDVAPFAALHDSSPQAWAELGALLGPGGGAALFSPTALEVPSGWTVRTTFPLLQMVLEETTGTASAQTGEVVPLQNSDAAAMRQLVGLTRPGPFSARTPELGRYVGVWEHGELIALAGERARLPGYCEVSAVCVHPQAQGRGLGAAVVQRVVEGIQARGEVPFLHVVPENVAAKKVYVRLRFGVRAELVGTVVEKGA